jgi:hypothetical protein
MSAFLQTSFSPSWKWWSKPTRLLYLWWNISYSSIPYVTRVPYVLSSQEIIWVVSSFPVSDEYEGHHHLFSMAVWGNRLQFPKLCPREGEWKELGWRGRLRSILFVLVCFFFCKTFLRGTFALLRQNRFRKGRRLEPARNPPTIFSDPHLNMKHRINAICVGKLLDSWCFIIIEIIHQVCHSLRF